MCLKVQVEAGPISILSPVYISSWFIRNQPSLYSLCPPSCTIYREAMTSSVSPATNSGAETTPLLEGQRSVEVLPMKYRMSNAFECSGFVLALTRSVT